MSAGTEPVTDTTLDDDYWTMVIRPQRNLLDLRLGELWRYRDLIRLFVWRDFVSGRIGQTDESRRDWTVNSDLCRGPKGRIDRGKPGSHVPEIPQHRDRLLKFNLYDLNFSTRSK